MSGGTRLAFVAALLLAARCLAGQVPETAPIQDNSFLIEEAYNQEAGVVQHINTFLRDRETGEWAYSFTQEWPLGGVAHQLSFTLPAQGAEGRRGIGDLALNYRYQLAGDGGAPVAVSPRFSLLLPTGSVAEGRSAGAVGFQVNLPVSVVLSRQWVTHWNAGATYTPSAENAAGQKADTSNFNLGQSFIWQPTATVNLMLETVWESRQEVAARGVTESEESLFVSPGIRWALNLANGLQIVPGIALPIGVGPSAGEKSLFLYVSFEHAFKRLP